MVYVILAIMLIAKNVPGSEPANKRDVLLAVVLLPLMLMLAALGAPGH